MERVWKLTRFAISGAPARTPRPLETFQMRKQKATHPLLALAALAALGSPAAAQSLDDLPDYRPDQTLAIGAENLLACSAVFESQSADLELTKSTEARIGITFGCNIAFRLDAQAESGELRRTEGYAASNPQTFIAYQVEWPLLTDSKGRPVAPNFSAPSKAWAAGLSYNSGNLVGQQSGELRLTWTDTDARSLMPGQYRDSLSLTISAVD